MYVCMKQTMGDNIVVIVFVIIVMIKYLNDL